MGLVIAMGLPIAMGLLTALWPPIGGRRKPTHPT
jgi:hypothetical protein